MTKVLLVEDDKYMNETLGEVLTESGFIVDKSLNAKEAIEKINKDSEQYELMILDYNIQPSKQVTGIDIYDLAKKKNPNVKAIMISAYGDKKIKEKALKGGINFFIDKPFLISDLLNAVSQVTSKIN